MSLPAGIGHGVCNAQEMLEKLGGCVLIDRVVHGQLQCDLEHAQAVEAHPSRAVGLVDVTTGGQLRAAIKDADVI